MQSSRFQKSVMAKVVATTLVAWSCDIGEEATGEESGRSTLHAWSQESTSWRESSMTLTDLRILRLWRA